MPTDTLNAGVREASMTPHNVIRSGRLRPARALAYSLATIGIVLLLFPVYWMIVTSLTADRDLASFPPRLVPDISQVGVYMDTLLDTPILLWLANSAVIAFGTCICTIVLAFFAAYALSRYHFKGQGVFGFTLFATQMLPEALLVVPFYALFISLGLLNNLGGLVLAHTAFVMPVVVWLLKSAIDGIPIEVEESARMDGASPMRIVTLVVAPLVAPSIAAGAIVAFFYGWDEFLFAATFVTDEGARPASVGLASFVGEYFIPVNQVMAASVIYTLPAIVFFIALQRYVVSGLVAGSVKG
ncbi:carbohydrate ABC transporter permease [Aeromicrobium sp. CTD01-1L150]|uniref:carbohydrate ABC transporter permease n=1 Tax=Aeromicrobium sp. CTD01-1L150 TaxID=3341830 RepID=UPI0035C1E0F4